VYSISTAVKGTIRVRNKFLSIHYQKNLLKESARGTFARTSRAYVYKALHIVSMYIHMKTRICKEKATYNGEVSVLQTPLLKGQVAFVPSQFRPVVRNIVPEVGPSVGVGAFLVVAIVGTAVVRVLKVDEGRRVEVGGAGGDIPEGSKMFFWAPISFIRIRPSKLGQLNLPGVYPQSVL
jgi:hypothetical protein